MNKHKQDVNWTFRLIAIVVCLLFFVTGMYAGSVLTIEHLFKGAVMIAEGLEGTTFNIEVDINETLMVDRITENLNEYGVFELPLKNCTGVAC